MKTSIFPRLMAVAAISLAAGSASANSLPFSGIFTQDTGFAFVEFTTTGGPITLQTTSAATGGFDPYLTLFDANGKWLAENDDGPSGLDSYLDETLAAGTYWLAITQSWNTANLTGNGYFDPSIGDNGFIGQAAYTNFGGQTGNWALDIASADPIQLTGQVQAQFNPPTAPPLPPLNTVPEPGTLALTVLGLMGVFNKRRRAG